ncbi:DNA (cytosine-5-)-methyltransferase [Labedella populi]|nr:DNA (cytosine-5-)-methyltransferase [Labedella populi]
MDLGANDGAYRVAAPMSVVERQNEEVTLFLETPAPSAPEQTGRHFTFIDLFAGLGGFHVALSRLGGTAVFAAEWEPKLNSLYESNFGLRPAGDIALVDPESIPDHDVLAAGFPCQPFSKAGEQLGFEHTLQGQLFFHVAAIIAAKKPQKVVLENVPNLMRHRGGDTFRTIQATLRQLGYDVDARRYSPHHFGVPQIRDRVYIVASRDGLHTFDWPDPVPTQTDVRSVLDSDPADARPIRPEALRALEVWDDFLTSAPREVKLPSFPIWAMEFGATYPYADETPAALQAELGVNGLDSYTGILGRPLKGLGLADQLAALPSHARRQQYEFPRWKVDFIRNNRTFYEENRDWIDPWLERSKLETLPSSFQKFEWNAQGGQRSLWKYVLQLRASGVRVKRPTTSPSLVAMTDTQIPIIGWEKRYMTPRECARLQSLDGIKLPEDRNVAYKALGNAVNAEVVGAIAEPLLRSLRLSAGSRDVPQQLELAG